MSLVAADLLLPPQMRDHDIGHHARRERRSGVVHVNDYGRSHRVGSQSSGIERFRPGSLGGRWASVGVWGHRLIPPDGVRSRH